MSIPGLRRRRRERDRKPNRLRRVLSGATVAATAAAVAFGGTATAATAPPADRGNTVTKSPAERTVTSRMTTMRVTGLVSGTPDRAGNVTVRLADGRTLPIPAADKDLVMRRAAQQARTRLKPPEPRPCGTSWVKLKEKPNHHPVAMETGFVLNAKATGYEWLVTITGPDNYTHQYSKHGNLALRDTWQGGYRSDKDQAEGSYSAVVDPGASYVRLLSGELCLNIEAHDRQHLTKPKAACLKMMQANSGNGWILNSNQPVPHRNRTDPASPAGTRATGAQACLGKTLGNGSDPAENITGWQDAQQFAATHPAKSTLARCHLIAKVFGGKGLVGDGGLDNLVPCWQVGMNTGPASMRTFEMEVQKEMKDFPLGDYDAVYYLVTPIYKDEASTIPASVVMSAKVQRADGTEKLLFTNPVFNREASGLDLGN
ncbi:DNA/RNA non-specific endonuclease [Streptomyces huiliensis]|uniref:DNA/RNA non-specific endonuclease n=1 Tax=Streptomyces huiliensis TaxID=2876027 RepID=UPI001CBDA48A|nr:DNA/RNA non-specific endonuclease [Streptomyces huiliensis]MBZ4320925.1 DNA/RNA non-specific endonuclease [Streptomyces huiliensis]